MTDRHRAREPGGILPGGCAARFPGSNPMSLRTQGSRPGLYYLAHCVGSSNLDDRRIVICNIGKTARVLVAAPVAVPVVVIVVVPVPVPVPVVVIVVVPVPIPVPVVVIVV